MSFSAPQISGVPTQIGAYQFTILVRDAAGNSASQAGSILINPNQVDLLVSQSTLDFSLASGALTLPAPASVTLRSSKVEQRLAYDVNLISEAGWLQISGGGTTPGSLSVSLAPSALQLPASVTPYRAGISITCASSTPCVGGAKSIVVSLTVSAPQPKLSVGSDVLSFSTMVSRPGVLSQGFSLQNTGGGKLIIYSVQSSAGWLGIANSPTELQAGLSGTVSLTVDPKGLPAGVYPAVVTIDSSAGSAQVRVNLRVAAKPTLVAAPRRGAVPHSVGHTTQQPCRIVHSHHRQRHHHPVQGLCRLRCRLAESADH